MEWEWTSTFRPLVLRTYASDMGWCFLSIINQLDRSLQEVGLAIPSRLKLSWKAEVLQCGVFNETVVWLNVTRLGMVRLCWDYFFPKVYGTNMYGRTSLIRYCCVWGRTSWVHALCYLPFFQLVSSCWSKYCKFGANEKVSFHNLFAFLKSTLSIVTSDVPSSNSTPLPAMAMFLDGCLRTRTGTRSRTSCGKCRPPQKKRRKFWCFFVVIFCIWLIWPFKM